MTINWQILIPAATTLGGALIGWFASRKRSAAEINKIEAETDKLEIDNFRAVINMWKETCEDLSLQVKNLTHEVENLRKENASLKADLHRFEKMIEQRVINDGV